MISNGTHAANRHYKKQSFFTLKNLFNLRQSQFSHSYLKTTFGFDMSY